MITFMCVGSTLILKIQFSGLKQVLVTEKEDTTLGIRVSYLIDMISVKLNTENNIKCHSRLETEFCLRYPHKKTCLYFWQVSKKYRYLYILSCIIIRTSNPHLSSPAGEAQSSCPQPTASL